MKTIKLVLMIAGFIFLVVLQALYLTWIGNAPGKYCDGFSEINLLREVDAYLHDGLTSPLRDVVSLQYSEIKTAHDRVKHLRDAAKNS